MSVILSEGKEGVTLCVRKATLRRECRRSLALFWQTALPLEPPQKHKSDKTAQNNQNGQQVSGLRCPQESSSAGGWHRAVRSCQRPTQQNASTRWALVTQPGPGRFMSLGTILCFLWNVWPDPLGARQCYFTFTPMTFIFSIPPHFCFSSAVKTCFKVNAVWCVRRCSNLKRKPGAVLLHLFSEVFHLCFHSALMLRESSGKRFDHSESSRTK